jgi:hypothetical protein
MNRVWSSSITTGKTFSAPNNKNWEPLIFFVYFLIHLQRSDRAHPKKTRPSKFELFCPRPRFSVLTLKILPQCHPRSHKMNNEFRFNSADRRNYLLIVFLLSRWPRFAAWFEFMSLKICIKMITKCRLCKKNTTKKLFINNR